MKIISLKQNRDFKRLYNKGKSIVTPYFIVYYSYNKYKQTRLGITATKKIGGAVERNRCRRIIKEAFRQILPGINGTYDFVIVSRARLVNSNSNTILKILSSALESNRLLK